MLCECNKYIYIKILKGSIGNEIYRGVGNGSIRVETQVYFISNQYMKEKEANISLYQNIPYYIITKTCKNSNPINSLPKSSHSNLAKN